MTVAFTICSNNYISQAKALADSLHKTNPEIVFYIGLVDKFSEIPSHLADKFSDYNIVEVADISIPNFDWMIQNYDIVELNTAVKPYYFNYFFAFKNRPKKIIYLDPDIIVFKSLSIIEKKLDLFNIILTPHLTQPITDDRNEFCIHEADILNHGVFNLGYIAVNNSPTSMAFLSWWAERLADQCKHDLCNGLFVDQLWCNLVPGFFDKVLIEKHLGMNIAYWNLQERKISQENGTYFVNDSIDLIFFHFSTFNPAIPQNIAAKQNRFTLINRPDLRDLYENYTENVRKNHFEELKGLNCIYGKKPSPVKRFKRIRSFFSRPLRWLIKFIEEVI